MWKFSGFAALALASMVGTTAQAAELITNGSFEAPVSLNSDGYCYQGVPGVDCGGIQGWTGDVPIQISATSTPWGNPGSLSGFDSSFGQQLVGLQNQGSLTQNINGMGGTYTLSWFDAGRLDTEAQSYDVRFDGYTLGNFNVAPGQGWTSHSLSFVAGGGLETLQFVGVGTQADGTAFLDKVSLSDASVSPVPEPDSVALMLAGLGVIGSLSRRRIRSE